jgi:hypothetical protein
MVTVASQIKRFERLNNSRISPLHLEEFSMQSAAQSKAWADSVEKFYADLHKMIYAAYTKREKLTIRAGKKTIAFVAH